MTRAPDPDTVRQCAKIARDMACSDIPENQGAILIVSRNQALLGYHAIMQLIDPGRTLQQSIKEVSEEDAAKVESSIKGEGPPK